MTDLIQTARQVDEALRAHGFDLPVTHCLSGALAGGARLRAGGVLLEQNPANSPWWYAEGACIVGMGPTAVAAMVDLQHRVKDTTAMIAGRLAELEAMGAQLVTKDGE